MLNRSCFLLLALFFAAPCLAAKPISLPMPIAQELPVEIVESQQEMGVIVPATAGAVGAQFGLVGALVGSLVGSAIQNAQVKSAEKKIVPLRDLLVEYRFNQKMEAALRSKLNADGISPSPVFTVMATPWEAHDAQQSAELPPQAMVLAPGYTMDSSFSQMTVSLRASVVDRTIKPNGKIKVVTRFNRLYSFQYPLQGARSDDAVQDWVKFESAGIAQLLDQGIDQVTDMLVQDFSADGRAEWETKTKKQSAEVNGNVYPGMRVRQGEGWVWVRNGKGWQQNVQGFQPLTVGVLPVLPQAQAAQAMVVATAQPAAVSDIAGGVAVPAIVSESAPTASDHDASPETTPSVSPVGSKGN